MKTSELITKAKNYLWDGVCDESSTKQEFICHAVRNASKTYIDAKKAEKFRGDLEMRLHPWNNMYSWLRWEANISDKDLTHIRVQEHRLKWMDKLIKEYKAKGD